jgi:Uncharacterized conserved protein (DUF2290)
VTTNRSVRDDVMNVLDYLTDAALALYANEVSTEGTRVSWFAHDPEAARHAGPVPRMGSAGGLLDWSLLRITYDIHGGQVTGHRLAYIPCPYILDATFLEQGEPIADLVEMYREAKTDNIALRSPIRFDYDPRSAKAGHPAAHMTINSTDCRIAVWPHASHRFVDFVFPPLLPKTPVSA